MKRRSSIYYSADQRSEIWDRWLAGESMRSIGRRFDRASSSVFSVISPCDSGEDEYKPRRQVERRMPAPYCQHRQRDNGERVERWHAQIEERHPGGHDLTTHHQKWK